MRTPAQVAGHPIHPMLVTLPIGLWVFSLVCDLIGLRAGAAPTWSTVALYTMVGGIVGALLAAIPGTIDMLSVRELPIGKTAITHMGLNIAAVVLYIVNAALRITGSVSPGVALALSIVGICVIAVSGWLGGKMVYEAGVAVHANDAETAGAAASSWRSEPRTGRGYGTGLRGEHAMAGDTGRPGEAAREDRASAVRSSETPRE